MYHIIARSLAHWEDPMYSGGFLGVGLAIIIFTSQFSLFNTFCALAVFSLFVNWLYVIGRKQLMVLLNREDANPYEHYFVEKPWYIERATVERYLDVVVDGSNFILQESQKIVLVDDPMRTLKASDSGFAPEESSASHEDASFIEEETLLSDDFEETSLPDTEKWEMIDAWLRKLYKDKPVPLFERNSSTVKALYKMALFNQQQDAMAEIILQQQRIHASEYRAEASRIKDILDTIGICKDNLPKNGVLALRSLASLATILDLGDVERSRLLLNLRERWNSKEKKTLGEWEASANLLGFKAKEYHQKLTRLERQYSSLNVEGGGLRYQSLKQKEEDVRALEKQVKIEAKKLQTYKVLPPDITLAQYKLDEARQTLMVRQNFVGIVVGTAMQKTVKVRVARQFVHPKVHKEDMTCQELQIYNEQCSLGDVVKIEACRPLSKMKSFTVTEILREARTWKNPVTGEVKR
ncbi:1189_t:CDS:10 [Acaulospora colombiana]|uniref:1189_t:CDS:1 n=1 Tax=Acaulospora colombiana TaxID=27376 RepID=A0ACA9LZN9_9GLOM|nr:1189_t:CDS:10 [Acaulospora colombiana]